MLGITHSTNICFAQKDNLKPFLFLSVFCEESTIFPENSADIVKDFYKYYNDFTYNCTEALIIPVDTFFLDSLRDYEKYVIRLFRIRRNTFSPPYYVLKMNPCSTYRFSIPDTLWIRISGYQKSDIKIFFDALRKQGMSKKDLLAMINNWCSSDEMFREIDWSCIMKGYYKNDTHSNCYLSRALLLRGAYYLDLKEDYYAVFSKKPLAGTLFNFD